MTIATGIALPPWCTRILAEVQAADQKAQALCASLTPEQMSWNPRPGSWSVAQCLEHLRITNVLYLPPVAEAIARAPAGTASEIYPGWFARWFIRNFIDPATQKRPVIAPGRTRPGPRPAGDVLQQLIETNGQVRDVVRSAARRDVNQVRFKNPFVHFNLFTIGTAFEVLAKHEMRHLLQAERVTRAAGFPTA